MRFDDEAAGTCEEISHKIRVNLNGGLAVGKGWEVFDFDGQ